MSTTDNADSREQRFLQRAKTSALMYSDSTINRIKYIATLATQVANDPNLVSNFLVAVGDLDHLWLTFMSQNQAVQNALLDLDLVLIRIRI